MFMRRSASQARPHAAAKSAMPAAEPAIHEPLRSLSHQPTASDSGRQATSAISSSSGVTSATTGGHESWSIFHSAPVRR